MESKKLAGLRDWLASWRHHRTVEDTVVMVLACAIGFLAGYFSLLFAWLIRVIQDATLLNLLRQESPWQALVCFVPVWGLLIVAWATHKLPEVAGFGIPEVISSVARRDGLIRFRIIFAKLVGSALCIGTGGSLGREGPIVQIGSAIGSNAGQLFRLSAPHLKTLVASGAAAGISATFNAPLAGVVFAGQIILSSFAVRSLTPVVLASVIANLVEDQLGPHGFNPVFQQLDYEYYGELTEMPLYVVMGIACGLLSIGFSQLIYRSEDVAQRFLPHWWVRAVVAGLSLGLVGLLYPSQPPGETPDSPTAPATILPPVFGVGYDVVNHALHLRNQTLLDNEAANADEEVGESDDSELGEANRELDEDRTFDFVGDAQDPAESLHRDLSPAQLWAQIGWLLPLLLLKPLLTSLTLAGGGCGGVFACSLYIGAVFGAIFGIVVNHWFPAASMHPGAYAVVGMGAIVAGTTHGMLGAMLFVYEMTNDYRIMLPIMIASGLSSLVASQIDPENIYQKKLSRRGEWTTRIHEATGLEHIMVRDIMTRQFPTVYFGDSLKEIVEIALENPRISSFPVLGDDGQLMGIIRAEDLRRMMDSDVPPHLVTAGDVSLDNPISLRPDENLLEALRDFASRDTDALPVEIKAGNSRRLIGFVTREEVMKHYRSALIGASD